MTLLRQFPAWQGMVTTTQPEKAESPFRSKQLSSSSFHGHKQYETHRNLNCHAQSYKWATHANPSRLSWRSLAFGFTACIMSFSAACSCTWCTLTTSLAASLTTSRAVCRVARVALTSVTSGLLRASFAAEPGFSSCRPWANLQLRPSEQRPS